MGKIAIGLDLYDVRRLVRQLAHQCGRIAAELFLKPLEPLVMVFFEKVDLVLMKIPHAQVLVTITGNHLIVSVLNSFV